MSLIIGGAHAALLFLTLYDAEFRIYNRWIRKGFCFLLMG